MDVRKERVSCNEDETDGRKGRREDITCRGGERWRVRVGENFRTAGRGSRLCRRSKGQCAVFTERERKGADRQRTRILPPLRREPVLALAQRPQHPRHRLDAGLGEALKIGAVAWDGGEGDDGGLRGKKGRRRFSEVAESAEGEKGRGRGGEREIPGSLSVRRRSSPHLRTTGGSVRRLRRPLGYRAAHRQSASTRVVLGYDSFLRSNWSGDAREKGRASRKS